MFFQWELKFKIQLQNKEAQARMDVKKQNNNIAMQTHSLFEANNRLVFFFLAE